MTLIREIQDRAACAAWSPIQSKPDLIALATKDSGSAGFDDSGGELEIYDFCFAKGSAGDVELLASIKTTARFASVAWTAYTGDGQKQYPLGLIAGGTADGVIHLWNPAVIVENKGKDQDSNTGRVLSFPTSSGGPIKALAFNPLEPFMLAAGGANGVSWIVDLSVSNPQLKEPAPGHSQKAEITSIAWNSQVAHIVATAGGDGSVSVWDLKAQKAWCELRAEAGQAVADLVWNPSQGLLLLTASADDRNPVVKVWDLAASTSMPVQQMTGHQGGILQLSWCPHDDTLLLTTAKDTRTFLWDLTTMQAIAELPNEVSPDAPSVSSASAQQNASALFAQATSFGQKHMRFQITWSPFKRGVALTCSLDKKVQAHSMLSLAMKSGRPPAWMKPAFTAIRTSFGGTLLTCKKGERTVKITAIPEQPKFIDKSTKHESDLGTHSIGDFCRMQQGNERQANNYLESRTWGFLRVLFETNARQALLEHLGFRGDEDLLANGKGGSDSDMHELTNGVAQTGISGSSNMSAKAQTGVQRALVAGKFEAAVDICFENGNLADALLLASCGGADLWAKTQQRYFESCADRPYLPIVRAVISNDLSKLVQDRDPKSWQETLAILSTYGTSEAFPSLCTSLGQRLEEFGDASSASICYMCALNLDETVKHWISNLLASSKKAGNGVDSSKYELGALHQFVVKVDVFLKAIATSESKANELSEETSAIFFEYANVLAEQGAFASAAKYCRGSSTEAKILRDRLYRSRFSQECLAAMGGVPPEFPYVMSPVHQSRGQVFAEQQREAARQQEAQRLEQQKQLEEQRRQQEAAREQQRQQQEAQQQAYAQQQQAYAQQQQQQQQAYAQQQQQQQQQQSYTQQQQQQQQSYTQQQQQMQAPAPSPDALPPGWVALQDPSSGRTYYANQTTGESSWEKPQAPVPAPAPQPVPAPAAAPQPSPEQPMADASTHSASTTPKKQTLASKYGDGFVSSASDPKLAHQYGNVGTGNPYGGADRPGTAAAVLETPREAAPVSTTMNLDEMPLSDEVRMIRDSLMSVVESLKATPSLTASDKRMLSEAEKGVTVVVKKLGRGVLGDQLKGQVASLASALTNRDFATASHIQTSLVNTSWKEQKDWLKGIKLLIQLSSKKLLQAQQTQQAAAPGYHPGY